MQQQYPSIATAASPARAEASAAAPSGLGDMEAVWKALSLDDGTPEGAAAAKAASEALTASKPASLAELDKIWANPEADGLPDGMESVWDQLQGGDYEGAWQAAEDAPYRFAENNPHLGGADLLERGTALFKAGELAEAILVLEAAVQQSPEDTIAWQTLGQAHADADDDAQAIACLRRAVSADPHNLDALLALGVSYTNELDQTRALQHLQLWLESHPDLTALSVGGPGAAAAAAGNPYALQAHVTELFKQAVGLRPKDPDLHAVLGVLYNLSRSYPQALSAFEEALRLRPTDYSLWNKLGATQANAMSCTEAVPCYVRALELKPQYVRALSNLGISYGNLGQYEAAATCYLKALSLNPKAGHIWSYLTITFTSMGRPDLVEKSSAMEPAAFHGDFDFA